jgi:hypothetical protein
MQLERQPNDQCRVTYDHSMECSVAITALRRTNPPMQEGSGGDSMEAFQIATLRENSGWKHLSAEHIEYEDVLGRVEAIDTPLFPIQRDMSLSRLRRISEKLADFNGLQRLSEGQLVHPSQAGTVFLRTGIAMKHAIDTFLAET